jgi:uncharacterized integral membrane protein
LRIVFNGPRRSIDQPPSGFYGQPLWNMNFKLLLKTVFVILVLLLLVLMGMYNQDTITFTLPPMLKQHIKLPAALMFFAFFAVGLLTGTILTAGGKRGGSKSVSAGK